MKISCILLVVASVMTNAGSQFSNSNYQPCDSPQYVELGTKGIVHCNFSEGYFGVYWYNSTDYVNEPPFISIKENRKSGNGLEEFDIYPNGSLVLKSVNFGHARTYTVVKLDTQTDPIIPHFVNVSVQASPTPSYPVIEGCNSQEACLLEVRHQGNLTCSVRGIFPSVDLEWRTVDENSHITFTRLLQHTRPTMYGRFNVTLTSSFYMNHTKDYTVKVECRVMVRENGPKFDLRSQVILLFSEEKVQMTTSSGIVPIKKSSAAGIVVPVIIIVVLIAICATVGIVYMRKKDSRREERTVHPLIVSPSRNLNEESHTEMGKSSQKSQGSREEQQSLLKLTVKVGLVKQNLQETYRELFGSIEVLPNIRDKSEPKEEETTIETVGTTDEGPTNDVDRVEGSKDATSLKDAVDEKIDVKDTEEDDNIDREKKVENQLRLNKSEEENAKRGTIETPANIKDSSTLQMAFTKDRFLREPKVQELTSKPGSGTQGLWKNVESVSKVLTDPTSESKRFIIEGEFGYETSTIGKLLAREWAMKEESPLASCFDILAILKEDEIHGDKTIFSEIRRLVHPRHAFTDNDIEEVLTKHDKVALILDWCSKYTDDECTNMIHRETLKQCTIILMTPSSCKPNDSTQEFTRLRVNNLLSEKEQSTLISQDAFLKFTGDRDNVRSLVKESFLLRDILQIPLFFDSFMKVIRRHLTNLPKFQSITSFFKWVLYDFYSFHPKAGDDARRWDDALGKVALETLTSQYRNLKTCSKNELITTLGEDVYHVYHRMGVLVEEKVFHLDQQLGQSSNTHLEPEITVTFVHFLLREWYAAQHLATLAKEDVKDKVKALLNKDCWYCIRFLCGINEEISREVIEIIEPKILQLMCTLEAKGSLQSVPGDIRSWCSKGVSLTEGHSRMQQMATLQLLDFGSKKEVVQLTLENSFNSLEGGSYFLELRSGVRVPMLENLKRLDIIEKGRELTEEEATGILTFALRCSKLEKLRFCQCIVPKTLEQIDISDVSKLKDVKVEWTPLADPPHVYYLGRKKLTWKKQKKENMDDVLYKVLVEKIREQNKQAEYGYNVTVCISSNFLHRAKLLMLFISRCPVCTYR